MTVSLTYSPTHQNNCYQIPLSNSFLKHDPIDILTPWRFFTQEINSTSERRTTVAIERLREWFWKISDSGPGCGYNGTKTGSENLALALERKWKLDRLWSSGLNQRETALRAHSSKGNNNNNLNSLDFQAWLRKWEDTGLEEWAPRDREDEVMHYTIPISPLGLFDALLLDNR